MSQEQQEIDSGWTKFTKATQFILDDNEISPELVLKNNKYLVAVYKYPVQNIGSVMHLVIERHDKGPIRKWEDLQRIKNEIAGEEVEGVELFPAEKRKIQTDKVHLWCIPPDQTFPFGFIDRVIDGQTESTLH